MTYEAGYNGKNIDGADVNYNVTRTGEISSEITVAYCAAGDGINRVYQGDESIILGGTNPTTGKETQHVPMILSCGYYDEYGCWNHWSGIQKRFTQYAENPFIAIGMEDMGHDYPSGIDPMRDYDRYNAYMQFLHSYLKPELYTPQVAWIMPVDGATDISLVSDIQVQLVKPAESLEAFKAAVTVKDNLGKAVEGTWTTNSENTSGLYTFVPANAYMGGSKYTVTVGSPVVAETTSKSFTVESAGFLRPVADTYISAANKAGVYGTEETLYIDNQRTYLATFKTSDFEDANKAYLNLALTGAGNQTLSVYLLDGFEVDESKTNYNNTPSLSDDKLIGTYSVSEGESKLDLLGIAATAKEEYFTLAISGSAHYYELNFEDYTKTTTVAEYDNNVADTVETDRTHYYSYADESKITPLKTRRGGGLGTRQIKSHSGEMVFSVSTGTSYTYGGYLKFYNSLSDADVNDIIGKTFKYSVNVKLDGDNSLAEASDTKPKIKAGIIRSGNNNFLASKELQYADLKSNNWLTISGEYTIAAANVAEKITSSDSKRYSYPMFGMNFEHVNVKNSGVYTYLVDDIMVQEVAPTALVSRESTSAITAYITTDTVDESGIVADTYVSKAQPDVSFGNSTRLLLNGGNNENIMFVTYSSNLIKGKTNLNLSIPAEDDASVNAEILLLDGYYVNEDTLTYNNMPDLSKAVSLGTYTLTGGANTIEIEDAADKIKNAYFTVVFKTDDSLDVVYSQNFENYSVGKDLNTGTNNVTDAENTSYQHYYGHKDDVSTQIARSGGSLSAIGNVLVDPDNSNNQTVNISLSTSTSHTYNGRVKLFNSVSAGVMTKTDPIIGQTLRFTAKIKAGNEAAITNKCTAFASAMLSAGTNPLKNANNAEVKSNVINVSNEWQTVTVDYTVRAEDIKVNTTANGNPVWGYPMFTLDFSNTNASNAFLIDDLTVVKLESDGSVSRLDIASSEGAKDASETVGLKARNAKEPIADTYVSALNKAGVFGRENSVYIDSQRTYLVTFKKSDFFGSNGVYLKLPLTGKGSQSVSAYILDGFKVDEGKTNYNNTPALTSDKLIGTYTATEGALSIALDAVLASVSSEYFTVAVSGSAHYFELNFEDYTADTTVNMYDHNAADSVNSDIFHMHSFAPESKLNPLQTRRGGALGTRKIMSYSDDMVLKVPTDTAQTYGGYLKFYNSLNDTYVTDDLVGKTFNYSVNVKLDEASNTVAESVSLKPKVIMGIMRTGGNDFLTSHTLTFADLTENNNGWNTLSGNYTIPAGEIAKKMTSEWAPKIRYSYPIFGMFFESLGVKNGSQYIYYVDDIVVYEDAPNTFASVDNMFGVTASIITVSDIITDTYVSRGNPDTNYGNETTLRFGDAGGDKKALVLSYMNAAIGENSYVDLKLNNSGEALKDVHVYYVLDYLADEATLTWNTMPEYEENLLGVYDIEVGDNRIDLSALKDKLTGEYFTLVLRTENHTFLENFESYATNYRYYDNTSKDNNQQDPDVSTNVFYHGFIDLPGMSRRGGNLSDRYVIADVDNANNKVLKVPTSVQSGDGRLKFYNSMNYSPITKESDIVGKTLRFSFRAMADVANCNANKLDTLSLNAGAMTSWTNANIKVINISAADLQSGWKTYTVDYTVNANDVGKLIKGDSWATGKPVSQNYTSFPMFGINFGDDDSTSKHTYLIDDLAVVEVIDGKPIGDAEFASREAEGDDIRFVSALNDNITIIQTTASSASEGDVIGISDGTETHSILRAENGKLMFGDTVLCGEYGDDILLTETPVKVVAIYDDVKGTVRFAVGDFLAYYKDAEGEIHATFEHLVIDGGVSDNASFSTKVMNASKLKNTTSEILGFQTHYIDRAVRFISGVDTIYYNEIGFKLETASTTRKVGSSVVYSSILGDDKDIYAHEYGYNLMSAISITDVKDGGIIKVTPFLRVGKNYIYGEEVYYKIMVDSKITITETNASEFGAEANADLASVTIDGEPVVGFSADVTEYNVPAANLNSMNIVVTTARPEATYSVEQNGNVATITVTAFNGKTQKVYTLTAYEKVETAVVNKNGANAIVTYVFDDGNTDSATIVSSFADKYPSFAGSFALITKNLATLSTIEGDPDDGLLEYEFDENGDYVYTKNESTWNYWVDLFDKYGDKGLEGVSHTHTHAYIGENDNGGAFEYRSTGGNVYTSAVFPIGNVRKEYYASNQILRELGQRALVMVGAGLTAPDGNMINYTESYKNLPLASGAFIGKRTTYTYPKDPESMVNIISDFDSDDFRFNVKSYMVQHYNTSPTAPASTSAEGYSKEACMNAGVGYWTDYIDTAVEMGGWAAFCFHNVKPDTHTGTSGHFVYESQADAVFAHTEQLSQENKVWVANFTDACLYVFERATSEVGAYIDGTGNVVVSLDDKENDEIFTMPLTVKVALPEGKSTAILDGEAVTTFTEEEVTYVYVDIVPGNSVTLEVE